MTIIRGATQRRDSYPGRNRDVSSWRRKVLLKSEPLTFTQPVSLAI
ncbi:hypothetical protein T4B_14122 [Trichinella pseudospiralis]|uniref:Uncharacterized protein n=1 Tax=Trichinella pseudospiralis TaxID=6337 RepID=A0A0V1GMP4_TRIPS|nr:hypothetical protein T4B_14122 [Trichinella pseudospiralis]